MTQLANLSGPKLLTYFRWTILSGSSKTLTALLGVLFISCGVYVYLASTSNSTKNTISVISSGELDERDSVLLTFLNWILKAMLNCEFSCLGKTCSCCHHMKILFFTSRTCVIGILDSATRTIQIKIKQNGIRLYGFPFEFGKLLRICPVIKIDNMAIKICLRALIQETVSKNGFTFCGEGRVNFSSPFTDTGQKIADFYILNTTEFFLLGKYFETILGKLYNNINITSKSDQPPGDENIKPGINKVHVEYVDYSKFPNNILNGSLRNAYDTNKTGLISVKEIAGTDFYEDQMDTSPFQRNQETKNFKEKEDIPSTTQITPS